MLDESYNSAQWTHFFTDGSADGAIRNGGSGIFVRHPDGRTEERAIPVGKLATNYRAEVTAVLEATKITLHVVFLTDCKSLTENLQTP